MTRILAVAVILLSGVSAASAIEVKALGNAAPAQAKIEALAFLEGVWVGEGFGGTVEESISAAQGGQIIAYFRLIKDGKPLLFEIETITEADGSLVYRLKHFNADFTGWEEKNETVDFKLVAIEGHTAYFDGLTLSLVDDNTLISAVLIGASDGTTAVEQLTYSRKR